MHQLEEASGDPGILDLEFHDEKTIRLESLLRALQGLARIDVVVDTDVGKVRCGRVRIEEREYDEVKLLLAVLDVAARVIHRNVNSWVLIWVLEV